MWVCHDDKINTGVSVPFIELDPTFSSAWLTGPRFNTTKMTLHHNHPLNSSLWSKTNRYTNTATVLLLFFVVPFHYTFVHVQKENFHFNRTGLQQNKHAFREKKDTKPKTNRIKMIWVSYGFPPLTSRLCSICWFLFVYTSFKRCIKRFRRKIVDS